MFYDKTMLILNRLQNLKQLYINFKINQLFQNVGITVAVSRTFASWPNSYVLVSKQIRQLDMGSQFNSAKTGYQGKVLRSKATWNDIDHIISEC